MNHSSPAESWSGTDHPDVDLLADLAEDLADPGLVPALRSHLDGCADCTDTFAALAEVSELLGTVPAPGLPAEVAERIDAALAAEAAAPVVLPSGRTEARARQRARSPRRRRVSRRVLVGAALAVLGTGLFAGLLRSLPTGQDTTASGSAKADAAAAGGFTGVRTEFTEAGLPAEVQRLVNGRRQAPAAGKGSLTARSPEAPGAGDSGADPSPAAGAEAAAVSCPGLPSGPPLVRAAGSYGREQVTALVFPLGPDRYDTYLVTSDCRTLLHRAVPAG
ncbi:hypothetical protein ACIA8O_10125 [Kitasatospora sp. NPDC051853]|uniref:hypothetical protein n=1 Tax=Kitasatospora sp. NPDC051853 TaxID=3364058 RepID=UPI00379D2A9E